MSVLYVIVQLFIIIFIAPFVAAMLALGWIGLINLEFMFLEWLWKNLKCVLNRFKNYLSYKYVKLNTHYKSGKKSEWWDDVNDDKE